MALKSDIAPSQSTMGEDLAAAHTAELTQGLCSRGTQTGDQKMQPHDTNDFSEAKGSEGAVVKRSRFLDMWRMASRKVISPLRNILCGTEAVSSNNRDYEKGNAGSSQECRPLLNLPASVAEEALVGEANEVMSVEEKPPARPIANDILPERFTAWLMMQTNTHGTLYIENVAKHYTQCLLAAPGLLDTTLPPERRSVFACQTVAELNALWEIFMTASNYKAITRGTSYGLSAGLTCYARYLQYLSEIQGSTERADFAHAEQCDPALPVSVTTSNRLSDAVIAIHKPKNGASVASAKSALKPVNDGPTPVSFCVGDPVLADRITQVLATRFANGYRLNSPIELVRFRRFFADNLGEESCFDDEELIKGITTCGTIFNGKVYAVSPQTAQRIWGLAADYFDQGAQAIFFDEFYAKNEHWLFGERVVSAEMLVEVFRKLFPQLSFAHTYFGYTEGSVQSVMEREILRVWGDDSLLAYGQLAERLTYVPVERIKYALGLNPDFIWNSNSVFSHISRIDITNEERDVIRAAAVFGCNTHGYVSVVELPFGEVADRKCELSLTAIHTGVFRLCLSDKFDKRGKIVFRKGDSLDALAIMKEYCRSIDQCSLEDLLNYEKELTGEAKGSMSMEAGYAVLVRIDKEKFVADRSLHFDVEAIDAALERCVEGEYLPLKSFTTFGVFPDCGYVWTLFLLESYCRRFSKKFRFETPSVNSRNVGIVIRKSCGMTYAEIMTDAVAQADVSLTVEDVRRFLLDAGYKGRSTAKIVQEIVDRAKAVREKRD